MTAYEWQYIYHDMPEFETLDAVVSEIYEFSDEEADDNFDVSEFLSGAVLAGIQGFHVSPVCDKSLPPGLQFADPSEEEDRFVVEISSQVNQAQWHKKLITLYNERLYR